MQPTLPNPSQTEYNDQEILSQKSDQKNDQFMERFYIQNVEQSQPQQFGPELNAQSAQREEPPASISKKMAKQAKMERKLAQSFQSQNNGLPSFNYFLNDEEISPLICHFEDLDSKQSVLRMVTNIGTCLDSSHIINQPPSLPTTDQSNLFGETHHQVNSQDQLNSNTLSSIFDQRNLIQKQSFIKKTQQQTVKNQQQKKLLIQQKNQTEWLRNSQEIKNIPAKAEKQKFSYKVEAFHFPKMNHRTRNYLRSTHKKHLPLCPEYSARAQDKSELQVQGEHIQYGKLIAQRQRDQQSKRGRNRLDLMTILDDECRDTGYHRDLQNDSMVDEQIPQNTYQDQVFDEQSQRSGFQKKRSAYFDANQQSPSKKTSQETNQDTYGFSQKFA